VPLDLLNFNHFKHDLTSICVLKIANHHQFSVGLTEKSNKLQNLKCSGAATIIQNRLNITLYSAASLATGNPCGKTFINWRSFSTKSTPVTHLWNDDLASADCSVVQATREIPEANSASNHQHSTTLLVSYLLPNDVL